MPTFILKPQRALAKRDKLEIFNNTVQGSQFTSTDFVKIRMGREIKIKVGGKGSATTSSWEQQWRTTKHEEVYPLGLSLHRA